MREDDIRPKELLKEYLRLSVQDADRIFSDPQSKLDRDCPGCLSSSRAHQFHKNGFDLFQCDSCSTKFVSPAPTENALEELYSDSPSATYWATVFLPAVAASRREAIFRPRATKILEIISSFSQVPGTIVDVGAGTGQLIEELHTLVPDARIMAIEPGDGQIKTLRSKGIEYLQGFVTELADNVDCRHSADLVICCELIEHVVDMDTFFNSLSKIAKPGGVIILTGLSGDGFDIEVLGPNSNAVSPPHHLTFLSREGLRSAAERCGLEILRFETPGKLDVDIVRNAALENSEYVADRFIRRLVLEGSQERLDAFQDFLSANQLSSHMWVTLRTPAS